jgi:predicted DCC family thiol-disulfide oxidoreductase YuxK
VSDVALLYDEDCGFCRWSLDKVLRLDRGSRIRPVAIQSAEGKDLLAGMDEARRLASWHLVDERGRIYSAGAAVPEVARRLPGGGLLVDHPHVPEGDRPPLPARGSQSACAWQGPRRARLCG